MKFKKEKKIDEKIVKNNLFPVGRWTELNVMLVAS